MAETRKKFTDLTPATVPLVGDEVFACVQGGSSKKATMTGAHGSGWWAALKAALADFVAPDSLHADNSDTLGVGLETPADFHDAAQLTGVTPLASIPAELTGKNAATATSAAKLTTARTIELTGDVTGSTSFDGSGNASIAASIATPSTGPFTITAGADNTLFSAPDRVNLVGVSETKGYLFSMTSVFSGSVQLRVRLARATSPAHTWYVYKNKSLVGSFAQDSSVLTEKTITIPSVVIGDRIDIFYTGGSPGVANAIYYDGLMFRCVESISSLPQFVAASMYFNPSLTI